jgi:hypothetical protein
VEMRSGSGVDGSIPKLFLRKQDLRIRQAQVKIYWCNSGNKFLCSIKYEKFIEQLCDCQLLKKDSAVLS